ncbi:hypothetical protein [Klebsiella michiganensis]|nr:hypothetical protein [Klebsiella michiganensis]
MFFLRQWCDFSSSYRLTVRFPGIVPASKGAECVPFTLAGWVVLGND